MVVALLLGLERDLAARVSAGDLSQCLASLPQLHHRLDLGLYRARIDQAAQRLQPLLVDVNDQSSISPPTANAGSRGPDKAGRPRSRTHPGRSLTTQTSSNSTRGKRGARRRSRSRSSSPCR